MRGSSPRKHTSMPLGTTRSLCSGVARISIAGVAGIGFVLVLPAAFDFFLSYSAANLAANDFRSAR